MKPKKFNQLLVVMEIFDECGSVVQSFKAPAVQRKKHKNLRLDMLEMLESDLERLRNEILKL